MAKEKEASEKTETKKKSSAGKIIFIILIILLVIALLCGGLGFLVYRGVSDRVEEVEEVWQGVEQEIEREFEEMDDEDEAFFRGDNETEEQRDEPEVDEELLETNLISDEFPEDFPLSGGKVSSSSFDQWGARVEIHTSSSVEEAFMWYEEAIEELGWIINSKSKREDSASIKFSNDLEGEDYREGDVRINQSVWGYTRINVTENY